MKSILIFSCILFTGVAFSQEAYIFSTFTDPYTEFSDGTSLVEEGWIEPQFSIPLGFDFTSLNVTSDMLVSDDVGGTYSILSANESASAVFGVLEYIVDGAIVNGAQASTISYKVEGVEGSQICKVQLTDCAFFYEVYGGEASAENRMSYQIWLYEGSNAVEIRFGPSEVPNPPGFDGSNCQVGIPPSGTDAFIYDANFYYTPVGCCDCPYPGSSFDNYNCYVQPIPSDRIGFVYNNRWYLHPLGDPNLPYDVLHNWSMAQIEDHIIPNAYIDGIIIDINPPWEDELDAVREAILGNLAPGMTEKQVNKYLEFYYAL